MNCFRLFLPLAMVSVALSFTSELPAAEKESSSLWSAGFAKVVITPEEPQFLSGYGGRNKPVEGKVSDLFARAIALRSPGGKTVVMVSTDLIGIPVKMAQVVCDAVEKHHGLTRADIMLTCSHTHCGPALDDELSYMMNIPDAEWDKIRKYQLVLNEKLIRVISDAIADLQPSVLETGIGKAEFAVNRRPPIGVGPIDHEVPVLRITSPDGKQIRGIVFGYACHCTVMSFYQWWGDYAGEASQFLEERHPGATALFFAGCGADQNPLPRRKLELGVKYGRMLATGVQEVFEGKMTPVGPELSTAFRRVDLEFQKIPSSEELQADLKSTSAYTVRRANRLLDRLKQEGSLSATYPYPVQVWKLGTELTWVALGGEVVVDYSLRLKNELGQGKTWVTGYANDVMCYIPSERVLEEGGYEGASSMIPYQQPSSWKSGLEARIVDTVQALVNEPEKPQAE
ncbi:neutral/alkaline non-lysosomal ceramidase N-terminal domain-containing protein [Symmachiella dynata]|uniref:neutral/alkaline non-lysosomal ceramidase N-terminal domain-containing protein n=1 Tax=Symmachiella dynata TaxID=2527995 RepID=UPI0030EDB0AB